MSQLYAPSSPHMHGPNSVGKLMTLLLLALVPGIVVYVVLFGWGVVVNILLANVVALLSEALVLKIRQRSLSTFLFDGSAIVTATLLAISIPPMAPWWIVVVGTIFAIVIAKHLYGGLGYNPFNPAMVGYAMLLVSFPKEMSAWLLPESLRTQAYDFTDAVTHIFTEKLQGGVDGVSGATPLDYMKTQLGLERSVSDIASESIFGGLAGIGFEWVSVAFLIGGLWLIYKKVINWHIPVAMLVSVFVMASLFYLIDSDQYAPPLFHVFAGATILGAFFIATDPVTAATTPKGRLIYGAGIGVLIYIIRVWGGFPDAVAFAVLLMNVCAPTIDQFTKPKVFGFKSND